MDKAGKAYWDERWQDGPLPKAVNPRQRGLNNYVDQQFHEYFTDIFSSFDTKGKKLLEIGCARSAWLPYFAEEFGFEVWGVDYSALGCEQARHILVNEGVKGRVVFTDFFSPPPELIGTFDVVVSFGVVEHFLNTSDCISAFGRFLQAGGLMITSVPNMSGLNGSLQKLLARAVFDIHVPLNQEALAEAHRRGGLTVSSCQLFLPINLSVVNIENLRGSVRYAMITRLNWWLTKLVWAVESLAPVIRPNAWSSPYINCLARKPWA